MTNKNMTVLSDGSIILDNPSLSDLFDLFYEDDSPSNEFIDEVMEALESDDEDEPEIDEELMDEIMAILESDDD